MTPLCKIEMTVPGFCGTGRHAMAAVSMSKQASNRLDHGFQNLPDRIQNHPLWRTDTDC